MANSHVGHNAILGNRVIMANGALVGGYAEIGDRAFISGNCMIHQFTRVGRLAMMSGGSAAPKDIPPFCMTQSSATSVLIGLNVVGLRRAGFTREERHRLKAAFKLLFLFRAYGFNGH
jgi:UDP-N-acetylglucosamine acyltransferase